MMTLTIYDIEFRFVTFLLPLNINIHLFVLSNKIFFIDENGELWQLVEQSFNAKLEFLLKKNLFDLAIK